MTRQLGLQLALLFITSPAWAFRPSDGVHLGIEPQIVHQVHPHQQLLLADSPAWKHFERSGGRGWSARFDESTGLPLRAWGPGIDLGPIDDAASVDAGIRRLITNLPDLFGAHPRALRTRSIAFSERTQTWYVDMDRLVDGHPIYRGGVTARVERGSLVLFGVKTYPDALPLNEERLDADAALRIARADGPAPQGNHTDPSAELVWLPTPTAHGIGLTLAWQTHTRTEDPVGEWVSFVDAQSGELLHVYNGVRFFQEGTVLGEHHLRRPDRELIVSPMPWVTVTDGDLNTDADDLGNYLIESDLPLSTSLRGSWLSVTNRAGDNGLMDVTAETLWTPAHATQAEIDSYVFLHHIRDWTATWAPELDIAHARFYSRVNIDDTCNAYYDGSVNFFRAGNGCQNTGQSADVNYHEFGHGVHNESILSGYYDGSLGEGAADTIAFFQTDDPIVAPGFMNNGDGIRRVDTHMRYPDDYVNNDNYIHYNGLIFAGSMWDLWHQLQSDLGEEAGTQATIDMFLGALVGGPAVEDSYEEVLLADDDDGDLGNGTPHQCAIIDAFGSHGLGPRGQGSGLLAHHRPSTQGVSGPHAVQAELVNLAPQCLDLSPSSGVVYYRVNGGAWTRIDLEVHGDQVLTEIPEQPLGSFVEYYLDMKDNFGGGVLAPEGGPINPFSYYQGDVVALRCDDFEENGGGYSHTLVHGANNEGADDWQWGTPQGRGGDPATAASGNNVWGNDLGLNNFNGEYQNSIQNELRSPLIDTGHHTGVFLQYQRWLDVEDGIYDQAVIAVNDVPVWVNFATNLDDGTQHHTDTQWTPHSVNLNGRADRTTIQLAWSLTTDRGATHGGWNIDDVCLYAPATPENRLGISDFVVSPDPEAGAPRLSWTQPIHAPLAEVVVVRKRGSYPTSHKDGKVIYRDEAPVVGERKAILDVSASDKRAYYYAVYASDGEEWNPLTLPGFNANTGGTTEDLPLRGCSSSGQAPTGLGLALGLLMLRRRRRSA